MTCKWQILRDAYNAVAVKEIERGETMDDATFWKSVEMRRAKRALVLRRGNDAKENRRE